MQCFDYEHLILFFCMSRSRLNQSNSYMGFAPIHLIFECLFCKHCDVTSSARNYSRQNTMYSIFSLGKTAISRQMHLHLEPRKEEFLFGCSAPSLLPPPTLAEGVWRLTRARSLLAPLHSGPQFQGPGKAQGMQEPEWQTREKRRMETDTEKDKDKAKQK